MERLACSPDKGYNPIEAAIHTARYASALAVCKGRRVLDIACGEGYGSYLLKEWGAAEVVGVDVAEEAIETAKQLFHRDNLTFICGDAVTYTDPQSQQFDLIISLETIEHVTSAERFLRNIKALATNDAIIIISCPNDHWYYDQPREGWATNNPFHLRRFTFEQFSDISTGILGRGVQWQIGLPSLGFINLPVGAGQAVNFPEESSPYVGAFTLGSGLICKSGEDDPISPDVSSYFMGIWGLSDQIPAAAAFPMSMDRFWNLTTLPARKDAVIEQITIEAIAYVDEIARKDAVVERLQREATAHVADFARNDSVIERLNCEIERQAADLARKDAAIEQLQSEAIVRADHIARNDIVIEQLSSEIERQGADLARKDAAIEQLQSEAIVRVDHIARNDIVIERLNCEIERQGADLARKDAAIEQLESEAIVRADHIARNDIVIEQLNGAIERQADDLARKDAGIQQLEREAIVHAAHLVQKETIIDLLINEATVHSIEYTRGEAIIKQMQREASARDIELARKDTLIELFSNENAILDYKKSRDVGFVTFIDRIGRSIKRTPSRWYRSVDRRGRKLVRKLFSESEGRQ
jgi:SAM-dependent methyltransferase